MYSFIDKLCWYHLQFQSKKLIYKKVKINLKIHSQIKQEKKKKFWSQKKSDRTSMVELNEKQEFNSVFQG